MIDIKIKTDDLIDERVKLLAIAQFMNERFLSFAPCSWGSWCEVEHNGRKYAVKYKRTQNTHVFKIEYV